MELVPIVAGVAAIVATAFVLKWLVRSPVGEAWAEGIRARSRRRRHWKGWGGEYIDDPAEAGTADPHRTAALEEDVAKLRNEVAELAERLDFAERMLAERRERKLGAGP